MTRVAVLGTSSGGIEALRFIMAALPEDLPVAVCAVMHTAPESPGIIPEILNRVSRLPVSHPRDRERLKAGHVYIAPPDYHLLLAPGRLRVTKSPRENRFR